MTLWIVGRERNPPPRVSKLENLANARTRKEFVPEHNEVACRGRDARPHRIVLAVPSNPDRFFPPERHSRAEPLPLQAAVSDVRAGRG
ncbi:hypothetical protein COCON_G00224470 [Conger conger]|uniref:Uncharacterized protein n=1 Tax=Conger conger TaxID=82655 RepID=A0A9Q1CW88_CONCO|nr:hypothetical protein COCON_G00224470 [Conger conger]